MIAALLLAAGESIRMGSPKPLLEWHGQPLVRYQVEQLRAGGCDFVVVVLGYGAGRVEPFLDPTQVVIVHNPLYRAGRATSVRAGAAAVPDEAEWVLVLGVDQPRPKQIVAEVVRAARRSSASIVIPTLDGRFGHPTAFAGRLLPEMRRVEDETLGLRAVVKRHEHEIEKVEIASSQVLLDLNTPEDYRRARFGS